MKKNNGLFNPKGIFMRISLIFCLLSTLCLTLSSTAVVKAQNGLDKKININLKETSFSELLKEIEISPNLLKDFLRGYFEGDGCITYANKEHTKMVIKICGTFNFLNDYQKFLPLKQNYKIITNASVPTLALAHNVAFNVCNYLYNDCSIYLKRKFELYNSYCRLYQG